MAGSSHPSLDDPNVWVPYRYIPTAAGAIIFIIAFALSTIYHSFLVIRRRTWYFIPIIIGGILEIVGYIGRLLSHSNMWALGPYIVQSILLLVAPALLAASIYIILGRLVLLVNGERYSIINNKWLTRCFVLGDIFSFLLQSAGGGIQASGTLAMLNAGEKIIVVGLFVQIASFGFFIIVAVTFHLRLLQDNQNGSNSSIYRLPYKKHLFAVYVGSILIMVRSVFRVIEYLMGNNGYLLRHEVFLYVFDATLMFLVMVIFIWIHPSEVTGILEERKGGNLLMHDISQDSPLEPGP